ncbi:FHA domain-containing protein [Vacuolonema iberomarrocanum]|uniref:FHA domain-containing protein n=1 Tax=Vacuolonema iberomarrocanum TaxID=3454632 RepID=UPI0019FA1ECC|nr:FHA domain-containing protein [filamentous cyanobacterium LEGE 07170]
MSSSASRHNHLLIVEDNKGRREYTLDGSIYSIGRDPKCDIRLVSQFVSRRHATLVQLPNEDGSYYYRIVDGNLKGRPSANGLLINGRKLQAHDLEDEDKIIFGPNVYAVYYLLKRDAISTVPPDEFDITLISPNMVGDPEDASAEEAEIDEYDDDDENGVTFFPNGARRESDESMDSEDFKASEADLYETDEA